MYDYLECESSADDSSDLVTVSVKKQNMLSDEIVLVIL